MLIQVLFAQQSMLADGQTLVGRENNDRVSRLAAGIERSEHAAYLRVQMRDEGIILLEMNLNHFWGARKRSEDFVAPGVIRFDQKRVLRQKIWRHLELLRGIQIQ